MGSGSYAHTQPAVHGLWPETGDYGASNCVDPKNTLGPSIVYGCYQDRGGTDDDAWVFQQNE